VIGGVVSFASRNVRPKRRTPAYTPRWQRPRLPARKRAPIAAQVNNEAMLFDRPASLPIATVHSSSHLVTFANQLRGTRDRGWRWMRPRLVPLVVAVVGMLAVLGAAEYLTHLARYTPAPPVAVIDAPTTTPVAGAIGQVVPPNAQPVRVIVLSGQ